VDLKSRLRAIVEPRQSTSEGGLARRSLGEGGSKPARELTYEPDIGAYEAGPAIDRVGEILGGRAARNEFGQCLVIDRRYESDRWHGDVRISECEIGSVSSLGILDPGLASSPLMGPPLSELARPAPSLGFGDARRSLGGGGHPRTDHPSAQQPRAGDPGFSLGDFPPSPSFGGPAVASGEAGAPRSGRRRLFIDLETTGLSGGAGTVAFLVGCGFYDLGAFQVRQFLLTSYSAERALLTAVAEFFDDAELIVSYNGKTFDVPVMETRWSFHRMEMPLDGVPHFDALHAARRLWKPRTEDQTEGGCRLSTLERLLFDVRRVGDVPGFEIPSRYFHFMRTGDPRPLEPVLEHNRLDLVSLAAVTARAVQLVEAGADGCPDGSQALAVGRIYERAGLLERAEACYRQASTCDDVEVRCESLYRLGLRCRRDRRYGEAAAHWREIVTLTERRSLRRDATAAALRQFAVEALAIHHEHRERDLETARELALFALDEGGDSRRADGYRHRLARLERKLEANNARKLEANNARKVEANNARKLDQAGKKKNAQLLWS